MAYPLGCEWIGMRHHLSPRASRIEVKAVFRFLVCQRLQGERYYHIVLLPRSLPRKDHCPTSLTLCEDFISYAFAIEDFNKCGQEYLPFEDSDHSMGLSKF